MATTLIAKASINIKAPAWEVWKALTTPELIKQYFFGTEVVSDWKVGSSLQFKGEWEGKEYLDKGAILEIIPQKLFRYNYISSFSGLEDIPENYANISYELSEENGETQLSILQDHVKDEEAKIHSEQNWMYILTELKKLLEKK